MSDECNLGNKSHSGCIWLFEEMGVRLGWVWGKTHLLRRAPTSVPSRVLLTPGKFCWKSFRLLSREGRVLIDFIKFKSQPASNNAGWLRVFKVKNNKREEILKKINLPRSKQIRNWHQLHFHSIYEIKMISLGNKLPFYSKVRENGQVFKDFRAEATQISGKMLIQGPAPQRFGGEGCNVEMLLMPGIAMCPLGSCQPIELQLAISLQTMGTKPR